jgi:protein-disulfide isomerase
VSAWVPRLALAALTVGLVAGIVSISVGEGGPEPSAVEGTYDVQRIYAGISQSGAEIGPPDAEVQVSVFTDLQCEPCAAYQLDVVEPLIEEYARGGEARVGLRHFSMGRFRTTLAAQGATAAGEQGKQWQFAGVFFRNQGLIEERGVSEEYLREVASAIMGFEIAEWEEDLDDPEVAASVEADADLALELRLPADPAVIVTGPGGQRELVGAPSLGEIEAAIAEVR